MAARSKNRVLGMTQFALSKPGSPLGLTGSVGPGGAGAPGGPNAASFNSGGGSSGSGRQGYNLTDLANEVSLSLSFFFHSFLNFSLLS